MGPQAAGSVPGRGLRAGTRRPPRRRHDRRRASPPIGSACRSSTMPTHGVWALGPGTTSGRVAQHGRRRRPDAGRPPRRSVPAVVAARAQGAARRLGQLLRLSHQPARVAGIARRARTAGPDRRDGRPRHRTRSTRTGGSTRPRRRTRASSTPATSPASCSASSTSRWRCGSTRPARSCATPSRRRSSAAHCATSRSPTTCPERLATMLTEVKTIPDHRRGYRAAIVDWVEHGAASRFALTPDEVVARSQPRGADEARAAACFELGQHLERTGRREAARAVVAPGARSRPSNWTYKRQAWTLVTTPEGADANDLIAGGRTTSTARQLARRRARPRWWRPLRRRARALTRDDTPDDTRLTTRPTAHR